MKVDKPTSTRAVTITPNKEKLPAQQSEKQSASAGHHSANASSQRQLLGLARQFVIDGALLPIDKQPPIEDRAKKRERLHHLRNQQNIEKIIQQAVQYCSPSEVTDRADQDWFNSFIELAEGISNHTMQDLWAKILAGEVTAPGSFSLKALKTFRTMTVHEAKLLSKACSLAVKDNSQKNIRIISGASQTPGLLNFFSKNREHKLNLSPLGLTYADLLTLADNHLLYIQETETAPVDKAETVNFKYNGSNLSLVAEKNNCILSFYKFTPIGAELAQLIADNQDTKYLALLTQEFDGLFKITHK